MLNSYLPLNGLVVQGTELALLCDRGLVTCYGWLGIKPSKQRHSLLGLFHSLSCFSFFQQTTKIKQNKQKNPHLTLPTFFIPENQNSLHSRLTVLWAPEEDFDTDHYFPQRSTADLNSCSHGNAVVEEGCASWPFRHSQVTMHSLK